MKQKYNLLENKGAFVEMLAFKYGINRSTMQHYFTTGYFPEKHVKRIEIALDLQLKADELKKEIQLKYEGKIN